MNSVDPTAIWIEIFTRAEFADSKREELIAIAGRLADLGFKPEHDEFQQVYRKMGCTTEAEFWALKQKGLPLPYASGSFRDLEHVTGIPISTLHKRKSRFDRIAAQDETLTVFTIVNKDEGDR